MAASIFRAVLISGTLPDCTESWLERPLCESSSPWKTSSPRKEGRIGQLVDRSSEISWRLPTYSVCVLNYYLLEGFAVGTRPTAVVNPWTLPFISSHRFLLPHAPLNHRPGAAHVMPLYHFCLPPHSSNCMWVVSSKPISSSWCTELTAISFTLFQNENMP